MRFHFSKEMVKYYNLENYGYLSYSRLYKVFDRDLLVGQCFCNDKVAFFAYNDEDIRIDIKKRFFKTDIYAVINQKNSSIIGHFDFPEVRNSRLSIGKMTIDNSIYSCKELPSDIKFKLLDRKTWWHYKIGFGNDETYLTFSCKLNLPFFIMVGTTSNTSFEGDIEMNNENLFLLFSGLFMLDYFFENADND
jgi:hypothetical protein